MQWKMGAARIEDLCISYWKMDKMGDIPATPTPEAGKPTPEAHSSPVIRGSWKPHGVEPYIFLSFETVQNPRFCGKQRVIWATDLLCNIDHCWSWWNAIISCHKLPSSPCSILLPFNRHVTTAFLGRATTLAGHGCTTDCFTNTIA